MDRLIEQSKVNMIIEMLKEMRVRSFAKKKIDKILKLLNHDEPKTPEYHPSLLIDFN